jgi:hypothetical protein
MGGFFMDKDKILEYVYNSIEGPKQEMQVLMAIEDAVNQIKMARDFFETVSEPKLVDYAIYLEQAAKSRYEFLLAEAKRLNIKTQHDNIFPETKLAL